jgi:hypothetical protein
MPNKTLLINQPGKNGDIIICLPIAKWYSKEYDVDWFCPEEYHLNFRQIDYCKPVTRIEKQYDKIVDMSFGITQGTDLHRWWENTWHTWQSFIIPKYVIAGVPLLERWNLVWNRDTFREKCLYNIITGKYGTDYVVVNDSASDIKIDIPVSKNAVTFEKIEDYNVFEWYEVLKNAKEIHCLDSLLCNFVDVIPEYLQIPKFFYKSPRWTDVWGAILINNWIRK